MKEVSDHKSPKPRTKENAGRKWTNTQWMYFKPGKAKSLLKKIKCVWYVWIFESFKWHLILREKVLKLTTKFVFKFEKFIWMKNEIW